MVIFNKSGETKTIATYTNCVSNITVSDPNSWGNTYLADNGALRLTVPSNSSSARTENITISYRAGLESCSKTVEITQDGGNVPPPEPPVPQYRQTSGTPYCSNANKYVDVYSQVSYDSGVTWETTATTQSLVQANSYDCGYRTRTVTGEPYCVGYDKYRDYYYQVSYNSGSSWTTTSTTSSLIEADSEDCGYTPPTPSGYSGQYLTFIAKDGGKFRFSGVTTAHTLSYSLDSGATWTNLRSNTYSPTVQAGQKIMWKGNLTPLSEYPYGIGRFGADFTNYDVEGNVMSLLYGDNFRGQTSLSGKSYAFYYLFDNYEQVNWLDSAEHLVLPATTLSPHCYEGMFLDCNGLTKAPELPATTLAPYCYQYMFDYCYDLTTAPILPATTLAEGCYYYMFNQCYGLTTAPSLPATTIAYRCYHGMFRYCTHLTTAPNSLPATTLAQSCYSYMFEGCKLLTTAPILPATTLLNYSYSGMFKNCEKLNYIKCLATNISATSCTWEWVSGVAASGTFVKSSSMSNWSPGTDGIPSGWTVRNA